MYTQVRKRTGDIVEFHPEKIHDAVTKAMKAVGQYDSTNASNVTHEAAERAVRASDDGIIAVDDIHRLVENTLMDYRLHDIAREYIAYRDRHKPDIFRKRVSIEPVEYPHLESYVESINHSYWLHTEFQYEPDIQDMRINMEPEDREVVKRSMLAISQVENAVKKFWARMDEHIPKPEISDVGYTFADSEVRHKRAYRHLLRIMGLHDEFEKLNDVPAMRKRIEYLERVNAKVKAEDPFEYFEAIVLFSMFIENVSLFSQFLIIMSFRKHENVLKGISNAIEATSKEENLHAMFGFDLVKTIRKENPSWWTPELVAHIEEITRQAEQAEIEVVEWIYEQGDSEVIPKNVAFEYVRFRLNESLQEIGMNPIFDIDDDIIKETDWFEEEIILSKNNDFFDNQSVDYTKRARAVSAHDLF